MLPFDSNKIHAVVGPHPAAVGGKLLLVVEELPCPSCPFFFRFSQEGERQKRGFNNRVC
jgi:hypothetical protein